MNEWDAIANLHPNSPALLVHDGGGMTMEMGDGWTTRYV